MAQKLTGIFETRQLAEIAVEHLVQEYQLDRAEISILPVGPDNTAGVSSPPSRPDPDEHAANSKITVAVVADETAAQKILNSFNEFAASEIAE
jgi:hypothetical protein